MARRTAASSSTSATCRPITCSRKLPSMYDQFKELADVDITSEPMEVGPTTHYMMGGIRVEPDTGATTVPGLFAAGEVAAGLHGANRLGGNSLSDLLVFGARTGGAAAAHASATATEPYVDPVEVQLAAADARGAARTRPRARMPYAIQRDLQATMGNARRDLPGRGRPRRGARSLGRAAPPLGGGPRRGRTHLQPGLAPRLRAAQPADRVRGDHAQRPAADREPRRPHPSRPPDDRRRRAGARSTASSPVPPTARCR